MDSERKAGATTQENFPLSAKIIREILRRLPVISLLRFRVSETRRTEESLRLPTELVEEILPRFPVKSLLRFRCVSKSWLSLIDSKPFIKTHVQYSNQNKDSAHNRILIFTLSNYKPNQSKQCTLIEGTDLSPLRHPISRDPITPDMSYNACCCNGMLCIYDGNCFMLLNPTTRVSKELPKDPEINKRHIYVAKIGFGWVESSGAYKVYVGWKDFSVTQSWCKGRVYNSKTNSWKTVEDPYLIGGRDGKFVGGKLHWLNFITRLISSLDVKSEVFGTIELPVETKSTCWMDLGVMRGCLCLSEEYYNDPKNAFDVWVMKESWEKLLTIHLVGEPLHGRNAFFARVIGEIENGEILIDCGWRLLVYCPRNGVIRQRREIGSFFRAHLCVGSLVSPVREISSLDI